MTNRSRSRSWIALLWVVLAGIAAAPETARGQDLLNDNPTYSPFHLELRPYVTLPTINRNIISMTTRSGDPRLYVATQDGTVFVVDTNSSGAVSGATWFNVAAAQTSLGHPLHGNSSQMGLQSLAFHPDFDRVGMPGYGKLYTTMLERRPTSPAGHFYLGDSLLGAGIPADGVLAEWTFDHGSEQVDTNSYRELFRVQMPLYDHPIKQARFNPHAQPGDEDYGLLYMTHGDSNVKHSPTDDPQDLSSALGKMIRINPLQSGGSRYTIPPTNPFAATSDPNVLKEIYAYGLRNPHTFSFNKDDQGRVHILVGDIGRDNMEEINRITAGGNFGWPWREGTFVHRQVPEEQPDAGYITGVAPLPANEATFGYMFPVAQFDHNGELSEVASGNAVASGFVIRNGSDPALHNQLIFNNFANQDGILYHADFDEMLNAVTELDPANPNRDQPGELKQALLHKLRLSLDHDSNPGTAPMIYDDFRQLLSAARSDTRYGEGVHGEMYISSKINGTVYLVTNSVPLSGDYNRDGTVDAADYATWRTSLGDSGYHLSADGNGNGQIDAGDYDVWRANFGSTTSWTSGTFAGRLSAVPEPTAFILLTLAVCILLLAARRRDFV
jgi:glucose/arabinose dehydrogenase